METSTYQQTEILEQIPVRSRQPNTFHAVAYANRGWATTPLAANTKKPLKGSHGLHEATTDRNALNSIFAQPELNVGIRTGEISNLVVVDIDCHNEKANGYESLKELARQGLTLPTGSAKRGCGLATTPSGGLHLYYALRDGMQMKNSSNEVAPGIDIRAEGGYVVAPPSRTADGLYQWKQYPVQLLEVPEWLAESCKKVDTYHNPQSRRPIRPTTDISPKVAEVLRNRLNRIATSPIGQRNHTLNREAFYLAQFTGKGFTLADLDAWLLDAAQQADMPAFEARRTIDSAFRAAPIRTVPTSKPADSSEEPQGYRRSFH